MTFSGNLCVAGGKNGVFKQRLFCLTAVCLMLVANAVQAEPLLQPVVKPLLAQASTGDKKTASAKKPIGAGGASSASKAANAGASAGKNKTGGDGDAKPKTSAASTGGLPKVMEFSASWCVPCKKFAPIFGKAKTEYTGKVDFQSYDMDDAAAKAAIDKYDVTSVPTIVMINGAGKVTKFENSSILEEQTFKTEIKKIIGK